MFQFPEDSHELAMFLMEVGNKYGSEQGYVLFWGMLGKPILVPSCPRVMGKLLKSNGKSFILLKKCSKYRIKNLSKHTINYVHFCIKSVNRFVICSSFQAYIRYLNFYRLFYI